MATRVPLHERRSVNVARGRVGAQKPGGASPRAGVPTRKQVAAMAAILVGDRATAWEPRTKALTDLRALVDAAVATNTLPQMEKWVAAFLEPLQMQLKELRSSIIKDTCTTLTAIVKALGDTYDESAATMLPMLFELSGSAKKVMSMSAVECMTAIVTHCRGQGHSFVAVLSQTVENKSAGIRAHCMSVVTEAVASWTEEELSAHRDMLQNTLQTAMQDSNADVRRFARKSFAVFWRLWPEVGDIVNVNMSESARRALKKEFPDLQPRLDGLQCACCSPFSKRQHHPSGCTTASPSGLGSASLQLQSWQKRQQAILSEETVDLSSLGFLQSDCEFLTTSLDADEMGSEKDQKPGTESLTTEETVLGASLAKAIRIEKPASTRATSSPTLPKESITTTDGESADLLSTLQHPENIETPPVPSTSPPSLEQVAVEERDAMQTLLAEETVDLSSLGMVTADSAFLTVPTEQQINSDRDATQQPQVAPVVLEPASPGDGADTADTSPSEGSSSSPQKVETPEAVSTSPLIATSGSPELLRSVGPTSIRTTAPAAPATPAGAQYQAVAPVLTEPVQQTPSPHQRPADSTPAADTPSRLPKPSPGGHLINENSLCDPLEIEKLSNILSGDRTTDWNERTNALEHLREMIDAAATACTPVEELVTLLSPLLSPLQMQLKELRSSIIKDTCTTLTAIVKALGDTYDESAATMLPMLFELSGSAKKVMSMSAVECMTAIVTHCRGQGHSFVAVLSQTVENKSAGIRAHCMSVVTEAVASWTEEELSAHRDMLQNTLQTAMQDSNADVRRFARKSFAVFWRLWPEVGDTVLAAQPVSSQRAMRKDYPDLGSSVLVKLGAEAEAGSRRQKRHGGARAFLQAQREKMREQAAAKQSCSISASVEQAAQDKAGSNAPVLQEGLQIVDSTALTSQDHSQPQRTLDLSGVTQAVEPHDATRMTLDAASPLPKTEIETSGVNADSSAPDDPAEIESGCAHGDSSVEQPDLAPMETTTAQQPADDRDQARMKQILAWKRMQSERREKFASLIGDQPIADEL